MVLWIIGILIIISCLNENGINVLGLVSSSSFNAVQSKETPSVFFNACHYSNVQDIPLHHNMALSAADESKADAPFSDLQSAYVKDMNRYTTKRGSLSLGKVDDESKLKHRTVHRYLCVITESNACDTMQHVQRTIQTLQSALGTHNNNAIDLISIRVDAPIKQAALEFTAGMEQTELFQDRLKYLASEMMKLKRKHQEHPLYNHYDIVINDVKYLQVAIEANVDGIHVKEKDIAQIPHIRSEFQRINNNPSVIIGISAHSECTALHNFIKYRPDYIFVGTCYMTQSHPEKGVHQLEGPKLPGMVRRSILKYLTLENSDSESNRIDPPTIFAIGGIEKTNCHEPVQHGDRKSVV